MKKRTTVSGKQQKISFQSSKKSPVRKIARRKKRESKKLLTVIFACVGVFLLTFAILYTFNPIFRLGLISPMPLSKEVKGMLVRQDDHIATVKKLLSDKHIAYATIQRNSGNVILVTLPSKEEVVLTSESDLAVQVSSLQVILTRLTMEGRRFTRLDMRFDKPVITYK